MKPRLSEPHAAEPGRPPDAGARFRREMDRIRVDAVRSLGPADLAHAQRISLAAHGLLALGVATAWLGVNPLSILAIALGSSLRFMVAHHVLHGAYERIAGVPARYTRRGFARGTRRLVDWLDWIEPAAWVYEHNALHHGHTNELGDPDLVERNFELLRRSSAPTAVKLVVVLLAASLWKLIYYAPNALNGLSSRGTAPRGAPHRYVLRPSRVLDLRDALVRRFWARSVLPYLLVHFVLLPAAFLPLSTSAALAVLINRALAELLTNLHSFVVIVPNHAGEDLVGFDGPARSPEERYRRQVLASTNYRTGGLLNDLAHLWLNYQIEHHCFPDLPMSAYPRIQPRMREACARHGVRYTQEPVLRRLAALVRVCLGESSLRSESSPSSPAFARLRSSDRPFAPDPSPSLLSEES